MSGAEPGFGCDVDGLEVAKVLSAAGWLAGSASALKRRLRPAELAADHLVLGAGIADDIDALDIDARPLADIEDQVDGVVRDVTRDARLDLDKGDSRGCAPRRSISVGGPPDGVAVVPVALADLQAAASVSPRRLRSCEVMVTLPTR